MPKLKPVVLSVASAFSIVGCASLTTSSQPWTVQPAFSVNHAGPKADAMYRLGRFYQGQRRYAEAIAAYRQALAMDAGYADAQNGLGVIYAEQGRHDEAVKAFQAAIAASPRAAYLHNNLGYVLLLQGSNKKAVEVLEEARRLEPGNAKVRDNLVIGYERLIEERKAQRPVQPDRKTTVAEESKTESAQASVEVRTALGFRRQARHGRPCRLRAASIRLRSGRRSDEAWSRLGSIDRNSGSTPSAGRRRPPMS